MTYLLFSNPRQAYFEAHTIFGPRYTTRPERAKSYFCRAAADIFNPDPKEFSAVEFDNSVRKEEIGFGIRF